MDRTNAPGHPDSGTLTAARGPRTLVLAPCPPAIEGCGVEWIETTADELEGHLRAAGDRGVVVVLPAGPDDPIATSRAVRRIAADAEILVDVEPSTEGVPGPAWSLRFQPVSGPRLRVIEADTPGAWRHALRTAARRVESRRTHAGRLARAADRLRSAPPAPPAPALLRGFFEHAPIGILLADRSSWLVGANAEACQLLRKSEEGIVGKALSEILAPLPELSLEALGHLDRGEHVRVEFASEGDRPRWFRTTVSSISDERESGPAYLILLEDITVQQIADRERQELRRRREDAERLESLRIMAGGLAHDLNNRLQVILGNLALAEGRPEIPEALRADLAEIRHAGEEAADIGSQLLTYSGGVPLRIDDFDLNRMIGDRAETLRSLTGPRIELHLELAPHLPPVAGSRDSVWQAVVNLVTNSVEALNSNEGNITIRTRPLLADPEVMSRTYPGVQLHQRGYVALTVIDDGCGIPGKDLSRVFDPFFTKKFTGRGLGLAAVLGIATSHGGAARIESEPGRGTEVTVLLPTAPQIATD